MKQKSAFSAPFLLPDKGIISLPYSYRMIRDSGLKIIPFDDLDEAAERAVELSHA